MIIYTAQVGVEDPLPEPTRPGSYKFVCFTDHDRESRGWEIRPLAQEALDATSGRRALARWHKTHPHVLFPEAKSSLWMDGLFQLQVKPDMLESLIVDEAIAFRHPRRNTILVEAKCIQELATKFPGRVGNGDLTKEDLERILQEQIAEYRKVGWPGLKEEVVATGFLLRPHTPEMNQFNEVWWEEISRWPHYRDQMSVIFSAWRAGIKIRKLNVSCHANQYGKRLPHKEVQDAKVERGTKAPTPLTHPIQRSAERLAPSLPKPPPPKKDPKPKLPPKHGSPTPAFVDPAPVTNSRKRHLKETKTVWSEPISQLKKVAEVTKDPFVVYTSIVSGPGRNAQRLHPAGQFDNVRFVCFTDERFRAPGWEIHPLMEDLKSPRWTARWHKMHTQDLFPEAKHVLWMDANMTLKVSPWELVGLAGDKYDLLATVHPKNYNIWEEAQQVHTNLAIPMKDLKRQIEHYASLGFDWRKQKGSFATGFLYKRMSDRTARFDEAWWHQLIKWGHPRDQMSIDFCIYRTKTREGRIAGHFVNNNRFFHYYTHAGKGNMKVNPAWSKMQTRLEAEGVKFL